MAERRLEGRVLFSVIDRLHYGFDVFTLDLLPTFDAAANTQKVNDKRLTDGRSVNYNAQFVGAPDAKLIAQRNNHVFAKSETELGEVEEEDEAVVFVSERTGNARIHLSFVAGDGSGTRCLILGPLKAGDGFFFDRPIIKNGMAYYISSREAAVKPLTSWSAVYSTDLKTGDALRLTPREVTDYSPSISPSGKWMMVASYGAREWQMAQIEDLETDLYVFKAEDGSARKMVAERGGWPTWADENTVYFHKRAEDGWWSIYKLKLPACSELQQLDQPIKPERVTPSSVHAFTPCASTTANWIAVATRRAGSKFRHIEIFDLNSKSFIPVTASINPECHHYNPFVSPDSRKLGYHRFRGEDAHDSETVVPFIQCVEAPLPKLKLQRFDGFFPTFSPDGSLIAFNRRIGQESGVYVAKADGSKVWKLFKGFAFAPTWNGKHGGLVYSSVGPIFASDKTTVNIISIHFNPEELESRGEKAKIEMRTLTKDGTNNNAFPYSSPDGKEVVFRSSRTGHKNLYIMDAEQGEAGGIRRLTEGPWIDTMPCWSPDGQWIAFSSNRHNPSQQTSFSAYMVRPDGTELHRVVGGNRERINHVCFSPDSKSLLFTANLSGVSAEPVSLPNQFQPYGELFVAALDGSEVQRLTFNAYEDGTPAWHQGCSGDDGSDFKALSLDGKKIAEEKLKGEFSEPLWLAKP